MARTFQIKRGLKADMPTLAQGELGMTTDAGSEGLFIGTGTENIEFARKSDLDAIPTPDVSGQIGTHNSDSSAHSDIRSSITTHTGDTSIHVTAEEKATWNAKADAPFKPAGKSYLTFSSPNSFTLKVNDAKKHWNGTLEYFASNKTWTTWNGTTTLSSVENDGEHVLYLRGTGNKVITGLNIDHKWVLTGSDIKCIGNIENLLDYATVASGAHPTMESRCYHNMFRDCTSLTQAPALPATTLADYCYRYMFYGCTGLIQAPALPATTLTTQCYDSMFQGCTSLTQVPALPATTLASDCYSNMFRGCISLTQAPSLPATTLASECYSYMFQDCTSLTQAPALPATTLAAGCYDNMFRGCTALTQAPDLPATTLANYCYRSIFNGCTSLTQVPALPATTLADSCYYAMFSGCTSLKLSSTQTGEYTQEYRIPSSGSGTTATNALTSMFTSTGGTLTVTPKINTTYYLSSDNMIVRETEVATLNGYVGSIAAPASHASDETVHVTAEEKTAWNAKQDAITGTSGQIVGFDENGSAIAQDQTPSLVPVVDVYSEDGVTYTGTLDGLTSYDGALLVFRPNMDATAYNFTVNINGLGSVSVVQTTFDTYGVLGKSYTERIFKSNSPTCCMYKGGYFHSIDQSPSFVYDNVPTENSHKFVSSENIKYYVDTVANTKQDKLFKPEGKSYLTFSSPNSFTLAVNDATKHWNGTLEYFASDRTWTVWDGTTTLSSVDNDGEYVIYIRGTGNTTITGGNQNHKWVLTGTDIACIGNIENLLGYTTVEAGNHPTMISYCYAYMFADCTALTQAPVLPSTTLTDGCYFYMFSGCTSLTKVFSLPATTLTIYCYDNMFADCTALTQAPALPATTLANYCYTRMFSGCTSLTQAPALPATTLSYSCYSRMFYGCTSLSNAPALPATTLANYCYEYMFQGCISLTQAPSLPATTLAESCYFRMFFGCTSLKLSSTQTGEYTQEYRIPSSGTGTTAANALGSMFTSTGGTFTGSPEINTMYYLSSDNMVVHETEIATLNGYVGSMIDAAIGNAIGGSY